MIWLKRIAGLGMFGAVLLYVGWAALVYAMQDKLLFHPSGESRAQLDAMAASTGVDPFLITTEDGVELYGWHRKGRGEHLLVFFHGNGGSISAVPWFAEQLPGIDVLCVSYRGYPGSDGHPSEAGMIRDARATWAYVTDELHFAPEQVVVQGLSMGGGVVHHLLMEAQPAGAVFDSTFSSIEELASSTMPFLPVSLLLSHPFRSYELAPRITIPTLVMHGSDDTLIPVWHGRKIAKLQPDATYLEIPNHGHDGWSLDRSEAQEAWRAFLGRIWRIDIPDAAR